MYKRQASDQIRSIFRHHTDLVEPLSLDEAYLDVTVNKLGIASATQVAEMIRQEIRAKTKLTASAGVSYNKFLAKLASDQNKPDGICVIRPGEGAAFVQTLPIRRFHGVGPRGEEKMARLGIATGADLAAKDRAWLAQHFGSFGEYLYRAARGIDDRPVRANRIRKSVGGERTFSADRHDAEELRTTLAEIVEIVWERIERAQARGRTVTLKLKYNDFRTITRARSLPRSVEGKREFAEVASAILEEVMPLPRPIRLMGLTLSSLEHADVEEIEEQARRASAKTGQLALF